MKQRILCIAAALLAALALAGCGEAGRPGIGASAKEKAAYALGVLGLEEEAVTSINTQTDRGGFHGDGTLFMEFTFVDDGMEEQIAADPAWQPLPPDDTVQALVWGLETAAGSNGPFLADEEGAPLVPPVKKGYYRLIDRQEQTDTSLLERGSFNFTVAVYDAEARVLYFGELDT
mgnify:FL=1